MTPSKDDDDKVMLNLVEPDFILGVGMVLTHGAKKYGANNWQHLPNATERYYAACMRHLLAWRSGEEDDEESGLNHLLHAATNLMFLLSDNLEV